MAKKAKQNKFAEMAASLVGTRDGIPDVSGMSPEEVYSELGRAGISMCDLCDYWFWTAEADVTDVCRDCQDGLDEGNGV